MSKILSLVTKPTTIEENKPVNRIWECKCGSAKFYLYEDQSVQCSDCDTYSNNIKVFYDDDFRGPSKGTLDK